MMTTIHYKNGKVETYPDRLPMINPEERTMTVVDLDNCCYDDIPLEEIIRIEVDL